jgi:hypothetical protein
VRSILAAWGRGDFDEERDAATRAGYSADVEDNVERPRRAVEAFNAREPDAMLIYFDPSIEFPSTFAAVGGGVYREQDGLRRWHGDLEYEGLRDLGVSPDQLKPITP